MKNRNIVVSFPLDRRTNRSRNDLLDGTNHEIEVVRMSNFDIYDQHFYIVSGFDHTRGCDVQILLLDDEYGLRKVPLLDYGELSRYAINARVVDEIEIQNLLNSIDNCIPATSLTTIFNIVQQHQRRHNPDFVYYPEQYQRGRNPDYEQQQSNQVQIQKQPSSSSPVAAAGGPPPPPPPPPWDPGPHNDDNSIRDYYRRYHNDEKKNKKQKEKIMVFYNPDYRDDYSRDSRKFILSSVASSLGFEHPRTVGYLPLVNKESLYKNYNISEVDGFRLLSDYEYRQIVESFDTRKERVSKINVIKYKNDFFVRRPVYENNFGKAPAIYDFGDNLSDCVKIDGFQKYFIDSVYNTYVLERNYVYNISGDDSYSGTIIGRVRDCSAMTDEEIAAARSDFWYTNINSNVTPREDDLYDPYSITGKHRNYRAMTDEEIAAARADLFGTSTNSDEIAVEDNYHPRKR